MNHSWGENNKCTKCGIYRDKLECRTLVRTYSKLTRAGIFEDFPVYRYDMKWHYFTEDHQSIGFERPNCTIKNKQP